MVGFVAFFFAAFAVVYAEPGSGTFWTGYALPALFVASVAYLFWWQGFVVLALATASWWFMDIAAGSWFTAGVLPLAFGACLVYFLWWLAVTVAGGGTQLPIAPPDADGGAIDAGVGDGGEV